MLVQRKHQSVERGGGTGAWQRGKTRWRLGLDMKGLGRWLDSARRRENMGVDAGEEEGESDGKGVYLTYGGVERWRGR